VFYVKLNENAACNSPQIFNFAHLLIPVELLKHKTQRKTETFLKFNVSGFLKFYQFLPDDLKLFEQEATDDVIHPGRKIILFKTRYNTHKLNYF